MWFQILQYIVALYFWKIGIAKSKQITRRKRNWTRGNIPCQWEGGKGFDKEGFNNREGLVAERASMAKKAWQQRRLWRQRWLRRWRWLWQDGFDREREAKSANGLQWRKLQWEGFNRDKWFLADGGVAVYNL